MRTRIFILTIILAGLLANGSFAQSKNWSLDDCLSYAFEHNVEVQKANLSTDRSTVQADQAKANRLPSVSASVRQNFSWDKSLNSDTGEYGNLSGSNSTSYSVSSSVTLFNGFKLQNTIQQSNLNLEASKLYSETVKESVELSVLNAFLQVIYDEEQLKNAQNQIESTSKELELAKERYALGAVSKSDYLQIEAELASEKYTLASAQSQLTMDKVSLMQTMELPVVDDFEVVAPDIDALLQQLSVSAEEVYATALKIKPQVEYARLNTQNAELDTDIAKASLYPSLSMDAAIGTGYSNQLSGFNYASQLNNAVSPSVGVNLSIPIFQKNQVKSDIALAKIGVSEAKLSEVDARNDLRKAIEQACSDASSAWSKYQASLEQYAATLESYKVAEEKFGLGAINSVDFLTEKTNLISTESALLQSKFNLVFGNKIVDFYNGKLVAF